MSAEPEGQQGSGVLRSEVSETAGGVPSPSGPLVSCLHQISPRSGTPIHSVLSVTAASEPTLWWTTRRQGEDGDGGRYTGRVAGPGVVEEDVLPQHYQGLSNTHLPSRPCFAVSVPGSVEDGQGASTWSETPSHPGLEPRRTPFARVRERQGEGEWQRDRGREKEEVRARGGRVQAVRPSHGRRDGGRPEDRPRDETKSRATDG